MLILAAEEESRIFIQNMKNSHLIFEVLKRQYGVTDLTTLNMSVQKLCHTTLTDKGNVTQYVAHMKEHINRLNQVKCVLSVFFIDSIFRMNFFFDIFATIC